MSIGKRILVGASLVLCASLVSAESVRVKAAKANVRSSPSTTASIVSTVAQGKVMDVVDVSGVWTKVTTAGVTGWVHNSLIEPVAEAAAPAASGGTKAAPATAEAEAPRSSSRPSRSSASASEEKKITVGVGGSFATQEVGIGANGRVIVAPLATLPSLRVKAGVDYFFKNDGLLVITGAAQYAIRLSNENLKPYVGAGIAHSRANGASSTDIEIEAGVDIGKRFFAEGRIVLEDESLLIFSAGVRF
jgi:hypothetical protein